MTDEDRITSATTHVAEDQFDRLFRPETLSDFVGQAKHVDNLRVYIRAALKRREPLDHLLFAGPPGLGKTTLARIIAKEMGVEVHVTSGPAVDHKGALTGLLTRCNRGDVLFIDEIHRLSAPVEEALYPAIEDFRVDVMTGDGAFAESIQVDLKPFTLIGATTRSGLLTKPLRERFGATLRLEFYPPEDLAKIISRSAKLLNTECSADAALTLAQRSRGTPRVANRLIRRVRDFAEVEGDGTVTERIVTFACDRLEVDTAGLDAMDRRLMLVLIEDYDGGPVGIETLSAALAEPRDTIEDVYEPYLLQQGFIGRTPRGRIATTKAYKHLEIPMSTGTRQRKLF